MIDDDEGAEGMEIRPEKSCGEGVQSAGGGFHLVDDVLNLFLCGV